MKFMKNSERPPARWARGIGRWTRLSRTLAVLMAASLCATAMAQTGAFFDPFERLPSANGWSLHGENSPDTSLTLSDGLRLHAARPGTTRSFPVIGMNRPDVVLSDFHVSFDVLSWDHSEERSPAIVLLARLRRGGGGPAAHSYEMRFVPSSSTRGAARISIAKWLPSLEPDMEIAEFEMDMNRSYRMVFSGVGPLLKAQLFAVDDLRQPIAEIEVSDHSISSGIVGFYLYDFTGANGGTPSLVDVRVDNFYAGASAPPVAEPALAVEPAVKLSWPGSAEGYLLESAAHADGTWSVVSATPAVEAGQRILFLEAGQNARFFRLRRP